jgi:hypothetical protein
MDFDALEPDDDYRRELPTNVWLMDNHKWALLAWEQHRAGKQGQCYTLFHADYHWDGVDDFREAPESQEALSAATIGDIEQMTVSEDRIQYDSFIAPAVRRGLLDELHMYCLQADGSDKGVDQDLCDAMGVKQVLHPDAESLAAVQPNSPLIFDLCLDLFVDGTAPYGEGDPWPDEEVLGFLGAMATHLAAAEVVTVSLSFGCSGTAEVTRHLASIVMPRILSLREAGDAS